VRRLTTNQFIEQATKIWGSSCSYHEVNYIGKDLHVKIFCNKHNQWFYQSPHNHYSYIACPNCRHETRAKSKQTWTIEMVLTEALKFSTRNEFQKKSRNAYLSAYKHGWLDSVCKHMKPAVTGFNKHVIYCIKLKGTEYVYIGQSAKVKQRLASHLYYSGPIFNKIKELKNIENYKGYSFKILKKNVLTATVCNIENSYKKRFKERGYVLLNSDKNDQSLGGIKKITNSSLATIALSYRTKSEFRKNSGAAYQMAQKRGILSSICSHMLLKDCYINNV
jgi:predicted GIY-YIG superfamily endonuclease